MTLPRKILVLDDDFCMGDFIASAAEAVGLSCFSTTEPEIFLEYLTSDVTLILLDLVMPTTDGISMLRTLGRMRCKVGIVLMSGAGEQAIDLAEDTASALNLCVAGHLKKPFRLKELEAILQKSKQGEL
jgi:DNA-binding response OmpR family regulator